MDIGEKPKADLDKDAEGELFFQVSVKLGMVKLGWQLDSNLKSCNYW